MKRYTEHRTDKPERILPPEEAERLFSLLRPVLFIDRGGYWTDRGEAEDEGTENLLFCDDITIDDGIETGWREIAWMPSYDPENDNDFHNWGSLTFEEFLAYENIRISDRFLP